MSEMFACASGDLKIFLCDDRNVPMESETVTYATDESNIIKSISWSKNNKYMAVLHEGGMPEILLTTGYTVKLVQRIKAFGDATTVSFKSCTKRHLCVGTNSGSVIEYDTICKSCKICYPRLQSEVLALDYNSNDSCLAAASGDGLITLYNTADNSNSMTYMLPNLVHASSMQFNPEDERILCAGTGNGEVLIWDVSIDRMIVCAQAHLSNVRGVVWVRPNLFISAGDDGRICVYSLSTNSYVFRNNSNQPYTALSVSSDEKTFAVGSKSGQVYFYDMRYYMKPIEVIQMYDTEITSMTYSSKHLEINPLSQRSSCLIAVSIDSGHENAFKEDKIKTYPESEINDSHKSEIDDIDSFTDSKDYNKDLELEVQHIKNEITQAINSHIITLAEEFDKCLIDITTYVKDQLKTLENTIDVSFATLLEVIDEKEYIINGTFL